MAAMKLAALPMPDFTLLFSLRERIASLQVLSCRLVHERVQLEQGLAKRRVQDIGQEPIFVRIGLCPHAFRSKQLSCAHTLARHTLDDAILVMQQESVLNEEEADCLRSDLQRISHAIHMTDWQKNEAEVRYALQVEQATNRDLPAFAASLEINTYLNELIAQHTQSAEELRQLHQRVLELLDCALAGLPSSPDKE